MLETMAMSLEQKRKYSETLNILIYILINILINILIYKSDWGLPSTFSLMQIPALLFIPLIWLKV